MYIFSGPHKSAYYIVALDMGYRNKSILAKFCFPSFSVRPNVIRLVQLPLLGTPSGTMVTSHPMEDRETWKMHFWALSSHVPFINQLPPPKNTPEIYLIGEIEKRL